MNGTRVNGTSEDSQEKQLHRADGTEELLSDVKDLVVQFIRSADGNASSNTETNGLKLGNGKPIPTLLDYHAPRKLQDLLGFSLPETGRGRDGVIKAAQDILHYSVNTWDQGFMDKLYHSTTPVGLAAELLISALNTNVHVYQTSPALTLIEKQTTRAMADMLGLWGPYAGGVSQSGGSAANQTSIIVARNTLFPETKSEGISGKRFVLFTSEHGHYSLEKAAQISGFGSNAVRSIPVDEVGRMRPDALEAAITTAKSNGETALYVNATAGTTVYGSFDPMDEIADICERHKIWMHVDGAWGASIVFSDKQKHKLKGIDRADSVAICPHKMMGVPLTCSLLLTKDLRQFHKAMTLPAGYLFHDDSSEETNGSSHANGDEPEDFYNLADLTPQCGRRGDSLKLALSWVYYGTSGYATYIDHAFDIASYLASLVDAHPRFTLISVKPPPCLQVCFYFDRQSGEGSQSRNSKTTEGICKALLAKGFMIDYAPDENGKFFRVVVNGKTTRATVENLVEAIEGVGQSISA